MGDLDTNYIAYFFAGLCKYRNLVLPAAPTPRANGHGSCGRITPDAENCVHYTSRRAFRRGSPVPGNNPAGCGSGGNRSPGRGLRPKPPRCRSQIESSYSRPSRKFRFRRSVETLMVWLHSRAGIAPGTVAQSRGDGVGSEAIGKCPPVTQNP